MKKITTIIAITLLAALLFTGCDFIPMKKDFSQYGFTFSIAGDVVDNEGNSKAFAKFDTRYGTMTFTRMLLDLGLTEGNIAKKCASKETIDGKGTIYFFDADEDGIVMTYYFVEDAAGNTWQINLATPEDAYIEFVIANIYKSIEFVTAE